MEPDDLVELLLELGLDALALLEKQRERFDAGVGVDIERFLERLSLLDLELDRATRRNGHRKQVCAAELFGLHARLTQLPTFGNQVPHVNPSRRIAAIRERELGSPNALRFGRNHAALDGDQSIDFLARVDHRLDDQLTIERKRD